MHAGELLTVKKSYFNDRNLDFSSDVDSFILGNGDSLHQITWHSVKTNFLDLQRSSMLFAEQASDALDRQLTTVVYFNCVELRK